MRKRYLHSKEKALPPTIRWYSPTGLILILAALMVLTVAILVALPEMRRRAHPPLPFRPTPDQLAHIEELEHRAHQEGYRWQPGVTSISHLSAKEFAAMLGARITIAEQLAHWQSLDRSSRGGSAHDRSSLDQSSPDQSSLDQASAESSGAEPSGTLRPLETDAATVALPERWDWRRVSALPAPRNQDTCGSCWAFAAVGALEGILALYDEPVDLSEQHAINCNIDNYGCGGGWMTAAYRLWRDDGAYLETDIPYRNDDYFDCDSGSASPVVGIDAWNAVSPSPEMLKQALLVSPVATAMCVYPDFQHYTGGVYEHEGSDNINHAVVLVGWDDTLGAWILRNSWGQGWGEQGYAYVAYDNCRLGSYTHQLSVPLHAPVGIFHTPLADTLADGQSLMLHAQVSALNTALDRASVTLYLDAGQGFQPQSLDILHVTTKEGAFQRILPALQAGDRIDYFWEAADDDGRVVTLPPGGAAEPFSFQVLRAVQSTELASASAWQLGLDSDDATAGLWEWAVPEICVAYGNRVTQPDGDHTPGNDTESATHCFVTGARCDGDANQNDIDGGATTLLGPLIRAGDLDDLRLRFWLWFNNYAGYYPWEDAFTVRASNDGGASWIDLYRTTSGYSDWQRIDLDVSQALALTDQMCFCFVAADSLNDSLVEVAIDDVQLLTATPTTTPILDPDEPPPDSDEPPPDSDEPPPASDGGLATRIALTASPNPFRGETSLRLTLPEAARVRIGLYDSTGRLVRDLCQEMLQAGEHRFAWDGRTEGGARAPAGRYWARAEVGARHYSRALTLLR